MARIFICSDTGLSNLLDAVAGTLRDHGHTVIRGPHNEVGVMKEYSEEERATLINYADIAVFTGRHHCSAELMAGAVRLRGICYPVIGVESLDLEAAKELGIIVGNGAVPGNIVGMAESTVMLILMLVYNVQTNIQLINEGQWRRPGHHSHQLQGKTIGLIGFGRIAREVAQRLSAFGVSILAYSPRLRSADVPPYVEKVELETLLRKSNVVSILTGLTPETRHMIDSAKLALMKSTAYLVNTARGAVVDETALVSALRAKKIAGAALDTFAVEPLPPDSPLRSLDNVILTPHCVGHTVEGWDQFAPAMIENIERILAGDLPLHCKNPEVEKAWRQRLARVDLKQSPM